MAKAPFRVLKLSGVLVLAIACILVGSKWIEHRSTTQQAHSSSAARRAEVNPQHEALILNEALKRKPGHAPVLLRLAQMAEESGNHNQAIRYLQDVLRTEPHNTDAQLELGRVFFQTGDVQGAITETKRILDRQPDQADALYNLGAIYANLHDTKLALQYWDRLVATSPASDSAQRAKRLMPQLAGLANPMQ